MAAAVEELLDSGISGPYALALGSDEYRRVVQTAENGGYPLLEHLRKIIEGPLVWAPGVDGAVVISQRGDDFLFESGQDLSIGYLDHDADGVRLYLEQSFSFHVATPEAAVRADRLIAAAAPRWARESVARGPAPTQLRAAVSGGDEAARPDSAADLRSPLRTAPAR